MRVLSAFMLAAFMVVGFTSVTWAKDGPRTNFCTLSLQQLRGFALHLKSDTGLQSSGWHYMHKGEFLVVATAHGFKAVEEKAVVTVGGTLPGDRHNPERVRATVVFRHYTNKQDPFDIAILKPDKPLRTALPMLLGETLAPGDITEAVVVGFPDGRFAVGRTLATVAEEMPAGYLWAPSLWKGASGAPMVNCKGEVIGMYKKITFAITPDVIRRALEAYDRQREEHT